ncbi:MAG: hypothetical protein AAFY88_25665, partial [Acidobacteriota bacterium]
MIAAALFQRGFDELLLEGLDFELIIAHQGFLMTIGQLEVMLFDGTSLGERCSDFYGIDELSDISRPSIGLSMAGKYPRARQYRRS